jgi:fructose-bisphosphate aldolase class 1
MPIIEPEVDIHAPDKAAAERLLKAAILKRLEALGSQQVMLKLTLPSVDDFYADLVAHPRVLRVVALSGGYARDEANQRLARNRCRIPHRGSVAYGSQRTTAQSGAPYQDPARAAARRDRGSDRQHLRG